MQKDFEKYTPPTQLLLLLAMSRSSRLLLRLAAADLGLAWVTLAMERIILCMVTSLHLPFLAARGLESSKLCVLEVGVSWCRAGQGMAEPGLNLDQPTWHLEYVQV